MNNRQAPFQRSFLGRYESYSFIAAVICMQSTPDSWTQWVSAALAAWFTLEHFYEGYKVRKHNEAFVEYLMEQEKKGKA